MSSRKSPEDKAKQWLKDVIAPYGGRIVRRNLRFGGNLIISSEYVSFEGTTHCLMGERAEWRNKPLPTYDWLLACFYTVLKDVGCTASRGKRAIRHHSYRCRRCLSHKMILKFLEERRGGIANGNGRRKTESS